MPETSTIVDFIRADLTSRIGKDASLALPLTLTGLATHYQVSLTPVRQAVYLLVREQVLLKQSNGRLSVNPHRAPGGAAEMEMPPERSVGPARWELGLIEEIVVLSLRGSVEYLREEAMAHKWGVGRSVLRQCFQRLAGKGLLEHVPRCGWRVRPCNEADLRAYLVAREAMELAALGLARLNLLKRDLERMLQGNAPSTDGAPPRLNNDLHAYLVARAENIYIQDFFERHGLYYTTLFNFAAPQAHVTDEMADQHREILTALIRGDWRHAEQALSRHIRAQLPIVKLLMDAFTLRSTATVPGATAYEKE